MDNFNESCEPMDIDLSVHSDKDMDISYGDSPVIIKRVSTPKHYKYELHRSRSPYEHKLEKILYFSESQHISDVDPPDIQNKATDSLILKEQTVKTEKSSNFKIITAALVVLLATVFYLIHKIECSGEMNIEDLNATLTSQVFGQTKAITALIEAMELKEMNKILFFLGGTGVGKTFVSSLILETIGLHSNVYHYTMPMSSDDPMLGLTLCPSSLVIVDDLTADDNIVVNIRNIISKAENIHRNITVILIFNCQDYTSDEYKECDDTFKLKILKDFSVIDAHKSFVNFEPLREQHLHKCIQKEIGYKKLDESELAKFSQYFNVTADGCKGVHSKMKYLNVI